MSSTTRIAASSSCVALEFSLQHCYGVGAERNVLKNNRIYKVINAGMKFLGFAWSTRIVPCNNCSYCASPLITDYEAMGFNNGRNRITKKTPKRGGHVTGRRLCSGDVCVCSNGHSFQCYRSLQIVSTNAQNFGQLSEKMYHVMKGLTRGDYIRRKLWPAGNRTRALLLCTQGCYLYTTVGRHFHPDLRGDRWAMWLTRVQSKRARFRFPAGMLSPSRLTLAFTPCVSFPLWVLVPHFTSGGLEKYGVLIGWGRSSEAEDISQIPRIVSRLK